MNNTQQIGDISEQEFILWALRRNLEVARPVNSQIRYDFLLFINGAWQRVQVKTARADKRGNPDNPIVNAFSVPGGAKVKRYTKEQIDYLFVTFAGIFWFIPIETIRTTTVTLSQYEDYKV